MLYLKTMKKLVALIGVTLFILGFVVLPSAHCLEEGIDDNCEHSESHCDDDCPICLVAATAIDTPFTQINIANMPEHIIRIEPSDVLFSDQFTPQNHSARAPPVFA